LEFVGIFFWHVVLRICLVNRVNWILTYFVSGGVAVGNIFEGFLFLLDRSFDSLLLLLVIVV